MKPLIIVFFSFPLFVLAQNKPLVVEGIYPGLYVKHTVAAKENYYSIGRIYNISPKEIAPFNNLEIEKGLSLHQAIKIPLSQNNFLQDGNVADDEVLVPLYHLVQGKEGLYRVSMNYNKIPVESIMKWNNLKSATVPNGTNLIIGYLRVKKDLSPLTGMAKAKPAGNIAKPAIIEKPAEKSVEKLVVASVAKPLPPPVAATAPVGETVKKAPEPEVEKKAPPVQKILKPLSAKNFNGGLFKAEFEKQTTAGEVKAETGEAASFKSTSGWNDGKYYCLHNSATPGTIIKITNYSTGKNVYAKVLDIIPDMEQNNGLLIRLSNAAADALGTGEPKFTCSLSYSK